MDGVTILNTIELTGTSPGAFVTLVITGLLFLILMSCAEPINPKADGLVIFLIASSAIAFLVCMGIMVYQSENRKTGELQYEVTIDDTVSMTEFNKKYEIIEQRGDIFVVKERE